jgi:putative protease
MLTRNCPIKQAVGNCKNCTKELVDRTGRHFPVKCGGVSCEIFNSDIIVMSDKLNEVDCDFIELDFLEESAEEVKYISECFIHGTRPDIKSSITRGLYIRGVQ